MLASIGASACGGGAAVEQRAMSAEAKRPVSVERIALPAGARATAAWVGPRGDGLVALADGRVLAIDARGSLGARALDRFPGDAARTGDAPITAFAERGSESPLALVPDGALMVDRGMVRRAPLPTFLRAPRSYAPLGADALWLTGEGLFASQGDRWVAIDLAPRAPTDSVEAIPFGAKDAWVRTGSVLRRLRVEPDANEASGAAARVTWIDPAPGLELGAVRSIARVDRDRDVAASASGITIVSASTIRAWRGDAKDGVPDVVGAGGGWAWVLWAGQILRTDGERWESLVGGVRVDATTRDGARIGVDEANGAIALVLDGSGGVLRVVAEETMRSSGIANGATLLDTRMELEAIAPASEPALESVDFAIDGKPIASRKEAPWGWGDAGARARELPSLAYGAHRVDVIGHFRGGVTRAQRIDFTYASPLGRVPEYGADVVPIFAARCARCHANGIARDLSSYAALSAQAAAVRASIREARMPPDILLDETSKAILTAWVDGNAPR